MAAIWLEDGNTWRLLPPTGFPDESALHSLVEGAPSILPLSGGPTVSVVGREVMLGGNYADLLGMESSGRPVVIEVKLATNQEARRAVIAQVLSYAAYLFGITPQELETDVLGKHLQARGFSTLSEAVRSVDQSADFDVEAFNQGVAEHLTSGSLRLVLVVDAAPEELVRIVGYLEAVTDGLVMDLVTVSPYDINGTRVMVPQRVDPGHLKAVKPAGPNPPSWPGVLTDGADEFVKSIADLPGAEKRMLERLVVWGQELDRLGYVKLRSYRGGKGMFTLLPRMQPENVGLVTIVNDNGAGLSVWGSVFDRKAPESKKTVEDLIAPTPIKQGNYVPKAKITDALLDALTDAYWEASGRRAVGPEGAAESGQAAPSGVLEASPDQL